MRLYHLPLPSLLAHGAAVAGMLDPLGGPRCVDARGAAVGAIVDGGGLAVPPLAQGALVEGIPVALCICGLAAPAPDAQGALVLAACERFEEAVGPGGTSILRAG